MSDFTVKIEYKTKDENGELQTVVEKEYDFLDYTDMLNLEIKNLLVDIENAFYYFEGNKQKEEWSRESKERFKAIRHKMLDRANAIKRLPETLHYKDKSPLQMSMGDYLKRNLK